jgi:hypothetical protein
MSRMRIALVTAGLVVAGGVFGTVAGTLVLLVWQLPAGGFSLKGALSLGVFFGGGLGALLGPLAACTVMRHVPLGLAVGGTTLGTFASGGLALVVTGSPLFGIAAGVAGFTFTAAALQARFPPAAARS